MYSDCKKAGTNTREKEKIPNGRGEKDVIQSVCLAIGT
jgi:hypothetical protein